MPKVKCFFCGQTFDREKEPCVKVNSRRYAHLSCAESQDSSLLQEQKDKDAFYEMVKSIYGKDYNFVMINKQATNFIKQYGYTWSGIYEDVKKYYQDIYKAQEKNKKMNVRAQVINFNIQSPRVWQQPPHLLDLEDKL